MKTTPPMKQHSPMCKMNVNCAVNHIDGICSWKSECTCGYTGGVGRGTSPIKQECDPFEHHPLWAGDGYFCSKCMLQFMPCHKGQESECICKENLAAENCPIHFPEPPKSAQLYNQLDHSHCWENENPPCGQRIEHLRCCLCELPNPKGAPKSESIEQISLRHGDKMYELGKKHGLEIGKREGLKAAIELLPFQNGDILSYKTDTWLQGAQDILKLTCTAIEAALLDNTPHHDKS